MSLWSLCIDPVPTEMKKGRISRSTIPCSPLKRKTPGSLCHRRLGKERRDRSSHWRMIKGKQRLRVRVGRVEGRPHREREGHPKGLYSMHRSLIVLRLCQGWATLSWERSPTTSLTCWWLPVDVIQLSWMKKRNLVGWWGWPSLFGKSWVKEDLQIYSLRFQSIFMSDG